MNPTQIEFAQATNLTDAARWTYDPDKDITPGAALKHSLLEQVTGEEVAITTYCTNRVWLQRRAPGRGVIGIKYLFDAEDLITRVSRQDIWKKNALRLTQNRTNSMKLECIQSADAEGTAISAGNINIGTYAGDLADFKPLKDDDYKLLAISTSGFELRSAAKICSDFSGLRGDTANRLVWIVLSSAEGLRLNVTERGSDRGIGLLTYAVNAHPTKELRLGIYGRFLLKVVDVIEASQTVTIKVDSLEKPTRIRFIGDKGWADLPVIEGYYCRALSQGAVGIFLGENYVVKRTCTKVFDIDDLLNGVSIQTPKKGASRNDVVLEIEDQVLKISKRSDIRRSEISSVPCAVLDEKDWQPVVVDHTYLTDSLEALKSFLSKKELTEEADEFNFDEDEKSKTISTKLFVTLTQAFNEKFGTWIIYIEPQDDGQYSPCRSALIVNTKERTNDFNEND
jgi:hypothetical protein